MQGLPVFQHDVVGDIDHVVYRAHAAGKQSFLHPARGLAYGYAGNQAGAVAGAQLGVNYLYRYLLLNGGGDFFIADFRNMGALAGQGGDFSGDADYREAVGAVRGDIKVENGITQVVGELGAYQ
ncbi:hypothetical protein ES703_05681 [subsurface metagenome]